MTDNISKNSDATPLTLSQDMFEKVMDSLDAIVYVADMQTYEIIFANKYLQETTGAMAGQICWQSIQGSKTGPCDFCSNHQLIDENGSPSGAYRWEHLNKINNRWTVAKLESFIEDNDRVLLKFRKLVEGFKENETKLEILKQTREIEEEIRQRLIKIKQMQM